MFHLAIIYDSGKRYILPFDEIAKKIIKPEEIEQIKVEVLKEISKE